MKVFPMTACTYLTEQYLFLYSEALRLSYIPPPFELLIKIVFWLMCYWSAITENERNVYIYSLPNYMFRYRSKSWRYRNKTVRLKI